METMQPGRRLERLPTMTLHFLSYDADERGIVLQFFGGSSASSAVCIYLSSTRDVTTMRSETLSFFTRRSMIYMRKGRSSHYSSEIHFRSLSSPRYSASSKEEHHATHRARATAQKKEQNNRDSNKARMPL